MMSVQDLISRIDQARSSLQEAKNQVSDARNLADHTSASKEKTQSKFVSQKKAQSELSTFEYVVGTQTFGLLGTYLAQTNPELLEEMVYSGLKGAGKGVVTAVPPAILAAATGVGAPIAIGGVALAAVGGYLADGYEPFVDEFLGENEDE